MSMALSAGTNYGDNSLRDVPTKKLFLLWVTHNNPKIEACWTCAKDKEEAEIVTRNIMVWCPQDVVRCIQLPDTTFPMITPSDVIASQMTVNWPMLLRQMYLDEFAQTGLSVQINGSQAEGTGGSPVIDMLNKVKRKIDYRINEKLISTKPNYDDSLTGINDAWAIVNKVLEEVAGSTCEDEGCPHYGTPHAHG